MESSVPSSFTCAGQGCQNPASLQCPTCLKLKMPASHFCSQECFRKNWGYHKQTCHMVAPWAENYGFTGPLRPGIVSRKRHVPDHIGKPDYADDPQGTPFGELRPAPSIEIKTPEQIEGMRVACRLAREVLDAGHAAVQPGITTDEIDRIVHEASIERDCYPSPLNYREFPKSVCTSLNEVICHGIPDNRELVAGDLLNIDVTVYHNGFHGDCCETYLVGGRAACKPKDIKLVRVAYECLEKAIATVRPGVPLKAIGNTIEPHASKNGFSVVRDYCGHGIGSLFHTTPNVVHYKTNRSSFVMRPNQTFTIEPMINQGRGHTTRLWDDDWTVVTTTGLRSAQFEHTLLVTETGHEILTARLPTSPPLEFMEDADVPAQQAS
eukprot:gnl/Trimastix_PCT/1764.p1 GENE.gnl/Trimastix_PCT/1764~~gnl/Trimastix_PCT/1764.p1  ORF type:complete len:392 (-),score=76.28 gnl/Trimastix_PCT/1764:208-1347(-)